MEGTDKNVEDQPAVDQEAAREYCTYLVFCSTVLLQYLLNTTIIILYSKHILSF